MMFFFYENTIKFYKFCWGMSWNSDKMIRQFDSYKIERSNLSWMSETIALFESQLLNKLQFKASSKVSFDAFLFKAFKFFDLYNNGWLSRSDFFKAIAKCGVIVDTHDMDAVFQHYGQDQKVDYKAFIENLLFKEEQISNASNKLKDSNASQKIEAPINPQTKQLTQSHFNNQQTDSQQKLKESKIDHIYNRCETYEEIIDSIKINIRKQGLGGLINLAVQFKVGDINRTHLINKAKLKAFFQFLSPTNLDTLYHELGANSTAEINYAELVYTLKGQLEEERQRIIYQTFQMLDQRKEGEITINTFLKSILNKNISLEMNKCVQLYCQFQGIDDGVFTEEDFLDFFGFLSFSHYSHEVFKKFIRNAFYDEEEVRSVASRQSNRSRDFQKKTENKSFHHEEIEHSNINVKKKAQNQEEPHHDHDQPHYHDEEDKKSVSRYSEIEKKDHNNDFTKDIELVLLRIKKRIATKGTKGFLLFEKAMKNADIDRDGFLNFDEFKQVIKEQRIDITNNQCDTIFDVFDNQGTGFLSFLDFNYLIKGALPEARKLYGQKLWNQVKLTEEMTSFPSLKHSLNFRAHPDIQNGRRYEDDIWKEIQETILITQDLNGRTRSDNIMKDQFDQYLHNLSLSIPDDKLFESVMVNFWKLNNSTNISEKYAGSRKLFDPSKNGYLMDHHRHVVKGGSVSQNAPFGTSHEATNYFTENKKL